MRDTKKLIQAEILNQLRWRPVEGIRVTEVARAIGINRVTFYRYYDSVFSVVQDVEDSFFVTFGERVRKIMATYEAEGEAGEATLNQIDLALQDLACWKSDLATLFSSNGDRNFVNKLLRHLREDSLGVVGSLVTEGASKELASSFVAWGWFGLVHDWALGKTNMSDDEFREQTIQLVRFAAPASGYNGGHGYSFL